MNAKYMLFIITCTCSTLALPTRTGGAEPPEGLTAFVETAAAELSSSPLRISQFQSATVDTIENLGTVDGCSRYLCWLKSEQGRVGYVAVAGHATSYDIVAFSSTVVRPDSFLSHLAMSGTPGPPLRLSTASAVFSVEKVPLVTARSTFFGGKPFEISQLAACLSGILNYLQSEQKLLLFAHIGAGEDPEYARRFKENPASAREPKDPNWHSFDEERRQVVARDRIPDEQTYEEKAARRLHEQTMVRRIIRRRLLNPANARDRLDVLREEWIGIDTVTRTNNSKGMKDAILLQTSYLDGNESDLEQDLAVFFRTRGRVARPQIEPFGEIQADSLPLVVIGPEDAVGIMLGLIDIDGVRFAFVFFPTTGTSIEMSLAEKLGDVRKTRGLPPEADKEEQIRAAAERIRQVQEQYRKLSEEKGIPYEPPIADPEQWVRESMERHEARTQASSIVEDRKSISPSTAENGIHVVRCSALASWRMLYVGRIEVGDNWGYE